MAKEIEEKIEPLKETLLNFYSTLHPYDFYSLYWLGGVAFFLMILIIMLRDKIAIAGFLLIIFLTSLTVGPFFVYFKMHDYLYGTNYKINYIKQMEFANVMIVKGDLTSYGEENITNCNFHSFVMPPQEGFMKSIQFLYAIKPIKRKSFKIDIDLQKGQTAEFKLKFTNFKYKKDINESDIYIYRECFNKDLATTP
jgi:hypothetical protein